ncbi:restriction endonuclease [Natrinema versiforme]|uniref:Restriction endonuclease n=1 Tax=Natrinema versiforme TaxID=88724 RepID=A0A4P8WIX2_9EURY|nr:restriction endonuclease [Natrinema versiforme]QCS43399.1 restriction endonuclease [Natrinema versiforme]
MTSYGDKYVVNETYRSSMDPAKDEFQTWLNGPIETGIRNSGGIRSINNPNTGEREFLVFYSDSSSSQTQNPWEDVINMSDGIAHYWGDAKARHRPDPDAPTGNGWVKIDYTETYAQGKRADAPPVLLFEQPESGEVTFRGVCVITDLRIERHKDEGETAVNYLIELAILDTDAISLEWIHRKARTGVDTGGPDAWNQWVSDGRIQRYSIYKDSIRAKETQYPNGHEKELLDDIRDRLDGPNKGVQLEYLLKFLLEQLPTFTNVELTPPSGDRGVDLTGSIDLLADTHLSGTATTVDFKAQAKNTASSISGKELSRLASRIDDGEIGLFFTTSHFTHSAQKENSTTYPVRLFAAADLVEMLLQTDLVESHRLNDEIVSEIKESA